MQVGLTNKRTIDVTEKNIASSVGSGDLPVFSTPSMINLIESTANQSIKPFLDDNHSTVGTQINVKHLSATPLGFKITCFTELTKIEGKRLSFFAKVFDEECLIGEGTHERYIIENNKFLTKTNEKLKH